MATIEQLNSFLDKFISAGEFLAPMIPGKVDDLLFSLAKFVRNDEVLQGWFTTALAPDDSALTEIPPVLVEAARRYEATPGAVPGSRMQTILAILQLLAEFRKMFPAS